MEDPALLRRGRLALVLALLQAVALWVAPSPASAGAKPTIRLLGSADEVTLQRWDGQVALDLGVYAGAVDGTFRIEVARAGWGQPVKAVQVGDGGEELRRIPGRLLNGFRGLERFFTITFRDADGVVVQRVRKDFCPTGYERQRLDDEGPVRPTFADVDCDFAFTRGIVWGIDHGWAVNATPPFWRYGDAPIDIAPGVYQVTVEVNAAHARLFEVPQDGRSVTLTATVEDVPIMEEPPHEEEARAGFAGESASPLAAAPARGVPAHLVPDLEALPAWNMGTSHEEGRDMLNFASTPWNSGSGQFVVEGFRRRGEKVMDAYQYFVDADGESHGRVPIGEMEFHAGGGHDHWHFLQFARFDLLSQDGREVVRSQKQGFCMAATHPIDLTIPHATMRPWETGLSSNCGGPTALWVREVLPSGWGDTYHNVSGQAFDITDVPNGTYVVRVQVDPDDRLHQVRNDNDEALRTVTLGGRPGKRTVEAAPWFGIQE